MASLNKVFIIGNLTRDIELRYTPKGSAVADMAIAVNRKWRDDQNQVHDEVTFVECAVWGKTAETCAQYLKKGSPCHVEGRLELQSWEDKTTGQKRSKLRVVAEGVQFLGSKPEGQSGGREYSQHQRQDTPRPQRQQEPQRYEDVPTTEVNDDDIPF